MRRCALVCSLVLALLAPAAPAPAAVPLGELVRLSDGGTRPLSERALANVAAFARLMAMVRFFHPSDQALRANWDRVAVAGLTDAERAADADALLGVMRAHIGPLAPSVALYPSGQAWPWQAPAPPAGRPLLVAAWTHAGLGQRAAGPFAAKRQLLVARDGRPPAELPAPHEIYEAELGGGVACRLPLALWADHWGTWPHRPQPEVPAVMGALSAERRAVRLASVAFAWAALQHFHPRLDRAAWAAALPTALAQAAEAPDARALAAVLDRMVVRLEDSQAGVMAPGRAPGRAAIALAWVEERLVVSGVPGAVVDYAQGDEVVAIGGRPAGERLAEGVALVSGASLPRRQRIAARDLSLGPVGEPLVLTLRRPGRAPWTVSLPRRARALPLAATRPAPVASLGRGAWYVDLTRTDERLWRRVRPRLAQAGGIVFDLRGTVVARTASRALGSLAGQALQTPGFEVPRPRRPDDARPPLGYLAYNLAGEAKLPARAAFLIDASTIRVGEVIAATVAEYGLGTLVGEASAGAAGDVDSLVLPGGFRVYWTGSDARGYDGAPLRAVRPAVAVPRTVAALREGSDEALARALSLVAGPEAAPGKPRRATKKWAGPPNQN